MKRVFFLIIILQVSIGVSQTNYPEKDLRTWFDAKSGITSTNLINGTETFNNVLVYKGSHKYYRSPYFTIGDISYLGQDYHDVLMMYDIFEDNIVVKFNEGKRTSIIQLLSNEIDGFELHDAHFDKLRFKDEEGFFELVGIYNSFKLYKKHSKQAVAKTNSGKTVKYEFVKDKDVFLVKYNNDLKVVQSKKDMYNLFPSIKNKVKDLLDKDKRVKSSWRNKEMTFIFKQIENLMIH